jgi:hypothetical protein|tara:strand:+ start:653 stop:1015 length:363 start_codon:yes stop_codon:yes gene_type:complete
MSLVKNISPKTLYEKNLLLLKTIFHHIPELPETKSVSYFNSILTIHNVIKNDLSGTCTAPEPETRVATIGQVFQSLIELEQMIFGETSGQKSNSSVAACLKHTERIIYRLESNQSLCTLL